MATESLIIELDAKTAKLDARLKKTEEHLDKLNEQTQKNDNSFKKFGERADALAGGLAKVATVVLAVNAAVTAMVLSAASGRKELEAMSRQAKTSTEDFQALAFATLQYGVNAEQIADISKDISDKVAEFGIAGTGAFQDYADSMKMTKDETRALAIEFQTLSSQEVIGRMVSQMEAAGMSSTDMTFALESMGNDLSKLQPLFAGNSKELIQLKKRFDDVNESLQITDVQADKLKEVSTAYTLMTSQLGNAATAISATLAPVMDDFFNDVIAVVPQATQTIIDFANSFLDAKNIFKEDDLTTQLEASQIRILELTAKKALMEKNSNTNLKDSGASRVVQIQQLKDSIEFERKRTGKLNDQLIVVKALADAKKLADAKQIDGGSIDPTGTGTGTGIGTGEEIQAIADRFKDEEQLLTDKLDRELEIIGENDTLKEELHDEYLMNIVAMDQRAEDEKLKAVTDGVAKQAKLDDKAGKAKIALESSVAKNAISLTKMVLGDSKAAALAGIIIQKGMALSANAVATASAATLAYASQLIPGDPTSIVRATAAAAQATTLGSINAGLIVATGIGQAAALSSGGGGGGSLGGGGDTPSAPQQSNFEAETTGLEVTDASAQGATTQTIRFAVDSGDDLIDAISNALNKANSEGR
tara:strand:+ start:504 stop:2444 length:1941 start_codon:yes stop_codon:yes gene_type:complete